MLGVAGDLEGATRRGAVGRVRAGAYVADPAADGKAHFVVNAKFKPNTTVVQGLTDLRLQSARFNSRSTAYEWLVVNPAAAMAQFKGVGAVNGQDGYHFMVWVTSGPDTFVSRSGRNRMELSKWCTTMAALNPSAEEAL
jgi:hypothetical protein